MIPRFVIKNITPALLERLTAMDYTPQENPMPKDILVLGTNLMKAPVPEKNPLLKVFDMKQPTYVMDMAAQVRDILEIAVIQKKWTNNTIKEELLLGLPANGKVTVTMLGIMIDSCIITIEKFHELRIAMLSFRSPLVASHAPSINPKVAFLTVGCADYSLDDIDKIIHTFEVLTAHPHSSLSK